MAENKEKEVVEVNEEKKLRKRIFVYTISRANIHIYKN